MSVREHWSDWPPHFLFLILGFWEADVILPNHKVQQMATGMYVEYTETRSVEHLVLSDESLGGWRGVCHSPEEDMATRCTE